MAEKGPSPFNSGPQMAYFLRRLGLRYHEREMVWMLRHLPQDPDFVWTKEELERWWAESHPPQDEPTNFELRA